MLDDVRFGWRKLQQQPGFTVVAVLTLALGIGATSAVFSLIGVLLTAPPYRHPETRAHSARPNRRAPSQREALVGGAVERVAARLKAFESFAGYGWSFNFLVIDDGSESLEGMFVSKDYFRVVGLEPVLGQHVL